MKASALKITFDKHSMLVNGQREFIRSGAMHYFRLPGVDMWKDRLYKLKAAGYNTVDLYFCWAYHSPAPGVYDFEGIRDIRTLLKIAEDLGFYLIARPGPYINAEYTAGGLPGWLLADENVILRHRTEQGKFEWSQPYMDYVREWWEQIIPFFKDYPYLLMTQIENEYATLDMEPEYMQALYDMTREMGVKVPLMHNDMYTAGLFEEIVDIYAFDNYSVTRFDENWRDLEGVFGVIDSIEESLRPYCQNRPLMVAELQAGWFAGWKGHPYEHIIEHLGREHIGIVTKSLIGQGLTIFNHYKAIGGTNWGYIGSTDTYTSYDFGAPISESGINTERLSETKTINYFLNSFDLTATERVEDSPLGFQNNSTNGPNCLYAIRKPVEGSSKDVILPESQWLFFRNLTESHQTGLLTGSSLKLPQNVELRPHEVAILPYYIPLKSGHTLLSASVEPVYQTDSYIIFKGDRPISVQIELKGLDNSTLNVHYLHYEHAAVLCNIHSEHGKPHLIHISGPTLAPKGYEQIRVGGITVYFLGSHWVDKMWLLEDGYTVFGPDERLVSGEYGYRNPSDLSLSISPHGEFSKIENSSAEKPKLLLPDFKHWKVTHEAPELYLEGHYQSLSPRGADFDVNGFYEGSAWYRYPLGDKRPESLLVNARHIWGAFINGHFVGEGHHWQLFDDNPSPGPQKIIIPPEVYESKGPKNLVIFVDGLGHPKGFHDDARQAQGLLLLKIDDEEITHQVEISAGLSCWKAPIAQALGFIPKTSPLVKLETHFTLPPMEEVHAPLGLSINNLKYERINIYLNGVLVGRHWQACQNQTLYYLPESLLKGMEQDANTLELILMNFSPLISLEHCIPEPKDVTLQAFDVFTKITI